MTLRFLFAAALACTLAPAQSIGFGIKGGVPLTDAWNVASGETSANTFLSYEASNDRYTIGPMAELRLPFIGFEVNALYRPMSYSVTSSSRAVSAIEHVSAASWEFPLLFKLHLPVPIVKPYAEGGPSFRAFTGGGSNHELASQSNKGFALGAGLDIKAIFIHINPEVRYTHWGSGGFRGAASTLLEAQSNQFEFLIGISN